MSPSTENRDDPGDAETAAVRSLVQTYTAAITAGDESAAARFTCRKTDGGLLWVSSVGRAITVLDLEVSSRVARVRIQVEGKPPSILILRRIDGAWCIWP